MAGPGTYKFAERCVCGGYARVNASGELAEHKTPQGSACYDRVKGEATRRARASRVCINCGLYVCVCSLLAMCWPIILSIALLCSGCVTGPDGRRVLAPAGRAVLEDIVACGGSFALAAAFGALEQRPPSADDYIAASRCHLDRVRQRVGEHREVATTPTVDHGRDVVEAIRVRETHDGEVIFDVDKALAGECEATARARLGAGEGGQP